ncbi:alpha/beta fold hydrolase [Streptomyces sp. FL06-04B]|uniref:alpha/beta hydrolase n=1 Tax=unclassified Streptomyces TaxID=2593676 RepID=UPI0029B9DC03|nr:MULTISPECIES: alpha/beta fold hydrolase [unclassified Streptomyces]MDX3608888.1 alpha/beta fold hydrolase [Streptomyces sp. FL06-04B]MDX3737745.1 alpha/beta fold hydrolase [Streptomyces sp. ID01-15D]
MSSVSEGRFRGSSVPLLTPPPRFATLLTDDGVPVEAVYEPCTAGFGAPGDRVAGALAATPATTPAIVVAHGFTGSADRPAVRRAARVFAQHAAVITFSFRGHGRSGGRSTVGDREVLDLAAAVAWARQLGHTRVVTVGFSMGGSVVLRHGALYTADPVAKGAESEAGGTPVRVPEREGRIRRTEAHSDAVVSVSAPARWYYRGTAPMRRLHWVVTRPSGRLVGRYGFRTRIATEDWDPVPLSPVASVPLIAPAPLLLVHGDRDPYFPLDHPRMLAEAAGPGGAELWVERGMGHAENAADDALLARIADWATVAPPA